MDRDTAWVVFVPRQFRRLPTDLQLVVIYFLLATAVITLPVVRESLLRPLLTLPFVLFVPGYVFIAALFPEAGTGPTPESSPSDSTTDADDADTADDQRGRVSRLAAGGRDGDGIDGIERVALSFGTSIAIVPLIGLILNFTPFGIRLTPIVVSLLLFCTVGVAVAAHRRRALPESERFDVDVRGALAAGWTELTTTESRADAALNVLLVVSVLLAVGSVGYAVAVPNQGEAFTEFYLLTEGEDGELVADGYPSDLTRGEPASLVVGVGNHEHDRVEYTVVVALQRVTLGNESGNTTVRVDGQRELGRFAPALAHNETWERQHTVEPTLTGERLRLIYFLYRGAPPATPSVETAYREVHLWVNVTAPQDGSGTTAARRSPAAARMPAAPPGS
jgi:uncharacterized membrane protein